MINRIAIAAFAFGSIFGAATPANANVLCSPEMAQTRYALEELGQAPDCNITQMNAQDRAFEEAREYCRARGFFTVNMTSRRCVSY